MKDRPKILIVEDETIVAFALRMKLAAWGYDPVGVERSGAGAITAFDREHPDLALLDIFLADSVDGIKVAQHIRDNSRIPFIFVTASQDETTRSRAMALNPAAVVSKPYDDVLLSAALQGALQMQGNHGETAIP